MRLWTSSQNINSHDTSELEKECDRLVYKLYQLTYEEIKISVGLPIDPAIATVIVLYILKVCLNIFCEYIKSEESK